jgi:hypothetical protein
MKGNCPLGRRSATCLKVILVLFCLCFPEMRALPAGGEASSAAPPAELSAAPPPLDLDNVTALFAQVAVGGGYSTIFALLNTGSTDLSGRLLLTDSSGNAMAVALRSPPVGSATDAVFADSMDILIPRGGAKFIAAEPLSAGDDTRAGWARVESSGGTLGGVATFQLVEAGELKTIAGVLAADAVGAATIPVSNDGSQERFTGYAVANPSAGDINIKIVVVNENGEPLETLVLPSLNPLGPGKQIARFLHEDSPRLQFKGSMVLIADTGKRFSVVALIQDRGLFTAVPVIPEKAAHVN